MSLPFALQRPELLLLLAAVPLLIALEVALFRARSRALAVFGGRGAGLVSRSVSRQRIKAALGLVAVTAVIVALSGPTSGVRERDVKQHGVDLVIALDVSQSMAAHDVLPDRLRAASRAIETLGRQLVGSRVALVLFAGQGIVRYPPTTDPDVLGQALKNTGRGFRVAAGTALRPGLEAALEAFSPDVREGAGRKAIVLFTDGEDTTSAADLSDVAKLKARNVRVYALGVATAAGGPVPTYDDDGKFTGNLLHADGSPIVTRLEDRSLRAIAEGTGGRYWQYTGGDAVVREVANEVRTLDTTEIAADTGAVPDDRYQWLVAIAVAALLAEWLISDRRRMPSPRPIATARDRRARAW